MVIKTPKLRYADSGFVRQNENTLHVELFNAGSLVLNLEIGKDICINKICYKKNQFNVQMLGFSYPDDFLENIFLKKAIYNSTKMKKNSNGFMQKISKNGVDITYKVDGKSTIFRDKTHSVYVKIKDLD